MVRSVLTVEQSDDVDALASAVDAEESLTATRCTSVQAAREALQDRSFDCVVTEYEFDDGSGLEVVEAIRETDPQTPCVLFTSVKPGEIDTASFEDLIVEYLNKDLPDVYDRLGYVVEDLIEHSTQVGFLKPDDEDERLEALREYDVEELPVEESFDRLTNLVATHFDVAVAFVGLIEEDRENFLACHGADWDSLTREETICTHSMLQEDVMVIEDISADRRFSDNSSLENLGIVSYAGANMTTSDGQVIGQLCLIDYEPREFSPAQREQLQQFAATAMEILELRQTVLDARATEVEG
jgi:GAF domain-containing protein